jgi:hypothetical protein
VRSTACRRTTSASRSSDSGPAVANHGSGWSRSCCSWPPIGRDSSDCPPRTR